MSAKDQKPRRFDSSDIDKIEDETLDLIIKILPDIELSLASWDGLKHKPKELEAKIKRYRQFHESLSEWSRKLLMARMKGEPVESRVDRLWEFISICRSIRKVE